MTQQSSRILTPAVISGELPKLSELDFPHGKCGAARAPSRDKERLASTLLGTLGMQ